MMDVDGGGNQDPATRDAWQAGMHLYRIRIRTKNNCLTGRNKQLETPRASTSASLKTPLLVVAVTDSAAELKFVNGLCHGPLFLLLSPFSYK